MEERNKFSYLENLSKNIEDILDKSEKTTNKNPLMSYDSHNLEIIAATISSVLLTLGAIADMQSTLIELVANGTPDWEPGEAEEEDADAILEEMEADDVEA